MKNKILINFGTKIRAIRKENGLSQKKLAEISGLHRNYIGMVERGERNPSLINIEILSKSLGKEISEIFKGI